MIRKTMERFQRIGGGGSLSSAVTAETGCAEGRGWEREAIEGAIAEMTKLRDALPARPSAEEVSGAAAYLRRCREGEGEEESRTPDVKSSSSRSVGAVDTDISIGFLPADVSRRGVERASPYPASSDLSTSTVDLASGPGDGVSAPDVGSDTAAGIVRALRRMRAEAMAERALERAREARALLRVEHRYRLYDAWTEKAERAHASLSAHGEGEGLRTTISDPGKRRSTLVKSMSHSSSSGGVLSRRGGSAHENTCLYNDQVSLSNMPDKRGRLQDSSLNIGEVGFQANANIHEPSKVSNEVNVVFNKEVKSLDLQGVFLKELEWIPDSLGKLTWLTRLNLSGNKLESLPNSVGDLVNLTNLDVGANQLVSLPDNIGQLTYLEVLNIENNKIEELPWTIGQCISLIELKVNVNHIKAIPEAIGNLVNLKVLSVNYNCLQGLPTTMANMKSLVELHVRFNQLQCISESLCLVTTLEYLDVSSNFTDLKELPTCIGRLQNLKHLDASNNHLTTLPDSFSMLVNLQALKLEGNPMRVPPLHIIEQGKEMVLAYMIDYVARKEKDHVGSKWTGNFLKRLFTRIMRFKKRQHHKSSLDMGIRA